MTEIEPTAPLGRLVDVGVRDAWRHEAHHFTVWLSQNLDRLSDVLGIPLELEDVEVQLGSFYADILARVAAEEGADRVLIENQLEASDHRHLGQILTYLAGAKVSTVVWISPQFREEHLSAIKWLNENTVTGFSFFAVKLRTVRIGDSAIAPLLEVLEKPNDWERRLQAATPKAAPSEDVAGNAAFWAAYVARHPEDTALGIKPVRTNNNWIRLSPDFVVSVWVGRDSIGLFVRPGVNGDFDALARQLAPHETSLAATLGAPFRGKRSLLPKSRPGGWASPEQYDALVDWLHAEARHYVETLLPLATNETTAT